MREHEAAQKKVRKNQQIRRLSRPSKKRGKFAVHHENDRLTDGQLRKKK